MARQRGAIIRRGKICYIKYRTPAGKQKWESELGTVNEFTCAILKVDSFMVGEFTASGRAEIHCGRWLAAADRRGLDAVSPAKTSRPTLRLLKFGCAR
jgi:hypothetical protein